MRIVRLAARAPCRRPPVTSTLGRTKDAMTNYRSKFDPVVAKYPFQHWQQSGLQQYTEESCAAFASVFDRVIEKLVDLGEHATEQTRLDAIRSAVEELNTLNKEDDSLIETGEREDLCELVNLVASTCGLDPSKYGDGEGPASEWREW